MRLTEQQKQQLKKAVTDTVGDDVKIHLFGSRVDDAAKGGDIDILVSLKMSVEKPASIMARITAKAMMSMNGRKIDVLLEAPNLDKLPIHEIAHEEGVLI